MEVSRVTPDILTKSILKAEYYGSAFRYTAELIKHFRKRLTLDDIRDADTPIRRGIDMPKLVDSCDAPVLVPIAAFKEPNVAFDGLERIDRTQHQAFRGSALAAGDLLIAMGGYIGAAAIVQQSHPEANIGRHTARVVIDNTKADKYYIWSFITSSLGKLQFSREVTGSVQAGVNLEDLRLVDIPLPVDSVQRYIGDKVRHAERLRALGNQMSQHALEVMETYLRGWEYAKALEDDIQKLSPACKLDCENDRSTISSDSGLPQRNGLTSRVPWKFLATRLDCRFYDPVAIAIEKRLSSSYNLAKLGDIIDPTRQITNGVRGPDFQPSSYRLVRLQNCKGWSINFDSCATISEKQFRENRRCMLQEGDVIVAIGGYVGHAAIARGVQPSVIGQHSAILPMGTDQAIDEGYLAAFLSSHTGTIHLSRHISGTVQAGINLEDLEHLYIPVPSQILQRYIGDSVRRSDDYARCSSDLITVSKLLVESLIEGKITEDEIAAAQAQLEQSKSADDRLILSRLYDSGIDATDGKRLFDDLDAFYGLLEEAKEGPTNNANGYDRRGNE